MDSPESPSNAIHPLVESENDGIILPTDSQTPGDDPMPMDVDDGRGEMLKGQNDVESIFSDLPDDGNLQVSFLLFSRIGFTIEFFCRMIFWKLFEKRASHSMAVSTILHC